MNAFVAERLRRYVQVVVNFVGVGSSPTECSFFVDKNSCQRKAKQGKKNGGTGIRARVKRITTAYANHYTIPPSLFVLVVTAALAQLGRAFDF